MRTFTSSCCGSTTDCKGKGLVVDLDQKPVTVSTERHLGDTLAAFTARIGIRRSGKRVEPGLYCVGAPGSDSPVFVSANYRLSFDALRCSLSGMNAYILVLDTRGINVWCAAGKGTFGTEELVSRISSTGLSGRVSHRKLILPQLGAPGVRAHEVKKRSGFSVTYGPVRASDIPGFMANGCKADPEMRRVTFTVRDRLVLTGIELVQGLEYALLAIPVFLALGFIRDGGIRPDHLIAAFPFIGAVAAGAFFVPVLLPWIPGRAFSFKGWLIGLAYAAASSLLTDSGLVSWMANLLMLPAVIAFVSLNFTGATTFTSLSGVQKEMKIGIPMIAGSFLAGAILTGIDFFSR